MQKEFATSAYRAVFPADTYLHNVPFVDTKHIKQFQWKQVSTQPYLGDHIAIREVDTTLKQVTSSTLLNVVGSPLGRCDYNSATRSILWLVDMEHAPSDFQCMRLIKCWCCLLTSSRSNVLSCGIGRAPRPSSQFGGGSSYFGLQESPQIISQLVKISRYQEINKILSWDALNRRKKRTYCPLGQLGPCGQNPVT